jgi:hypothetical protein
MHKEKIGNHMEGYLCVGVFIVSMPIHKLILRIKIMCCIICYQKLVIIINLRIQARKRLVLTIKQM